MKIITSLLIILMIFLFFAVPGSVGEKLEKELLYGFRILSGFILITGAVKILIIQIKRRKIKGYQSLTGNMILILSPLLILALFVINFQGFKFSEYFINSIAIPLWSTFAALGGLSLSVAVMRALKLRKWESIYLALISLIYLLILSLPSSIVSISVLGHPTLSFLTTVRIFFRYVFIGAVRGLLLGFFLMVFVQKLRILLGLERRKDEFIT